MSFLSDCNQLSSRNSHIVERHNIYIYNENTIETINIVMLNEICTSADIIDAMTNEKLL